MRRSYGVMLLVVLGSVLSSGGCRKDSPPRIDICLGDGAGGADCVLREGSDLLGKCIREERGWYCPPSALENAWMTTQGDMEAWSSWCYNTSKKNVRSQMRAIQKAVR